VNQLRQLMLEELRRRNFADRTVRTYLHSVAHFSRNFRRPPDQLGPEEIRKYQAMLFTKLKFSPNTVILRLAARLRRYVEWIGPIAVYPGEDELRAMAEGVFRVLDGDEEAKRMARGSELAS